MLKKKKKKKNETVIKAFLLSKMDHRVINVVLPRSELLEVLLC